MLTLDQKPYTYQQLEATLRRAFGDPEFDFSLREKLSFLEHYFRSPRDLAGVRVLDIGCGCEHGTLEVNAHRGTWAPWLCRAVSMMGGTAVGVDIGRLSERDQFEYHRIDLSRIGALSELPDRSFDAVHCSYFFSSPHLTIHYDLDESARAKLVDHLYEESLRLLKPTGVILAFDRRLDR